MFAKKGFLIVGAIGVLLAVIVWFVMQAFRASLIVSLGIIGANNARLFTTLVLMALSIVLILIALPDLFKYIKNKSDKKRLQDLGAQYRSKDSGPEEIREQLGLMKGQRTDLTGKIDGCISQLDEIAGQLDRFDRLIRINEADALSDAREALEETQRTICCNLKWIINSSIVASTHDQAAESRLDENIREVTEVNKALLDKDEEFLLDLADHLSQMKGEGQTFQLDAWRETIGNLNQKSIKGVLK